MRTILLVLLGLILVRPATAQQAPQEGSSVDEASRRERAIERCKGGRGTDCSTDAGLAEWLLQERERSEAEAEGSRSKHQTAPIPTPRPAN
jgi:hypothetical protein